MPVIKAKGFEAQVSRENTNIKVTIVEQTPEFTEALKTAGKIIDDSGEFGLRSNKFPNFNHNEKVFYLRGREQEKNNKQIVAKFDSVGQARNAILALEEMVNKVDPDVIHVAPDGTTAQFRQVFLDRAKAKVLGVTDNKKYPETCLTLKKAVKIKDHGNAHFQEHIFAAFDVVCKAQTGVGLTENGGLDTNYHKVSINDAQWAVDNLKDVINRAHEAGNGKLVALWRLMTALRSIDLKDAEMAETEPHRLPGGKNRQ